MLFNYKIKSSCFYKFDPQFHLTVDFRVIAPLFYSRKNLSKLQAFEIASYETSTRENRIR